jgi:hypothetical protein
MVTGFFHQPDSKCTTQRAMSGSCKKKEKKLKQERRLMPINRSLAKYPTFCTSKFLLKTQK